MQIVDAVGFFQEIDAVLHWNILSCKIKNSPDSLVVFPVLEIGSVAGDEIISEPFQNWR